MLTLISQSQRSLVYHHKSEDDKEEVWKIYPGDFNPEEQIRKELVLSQKLSSQHFRKAISKSIYHNQSCLVLEYVSGITLREFTHGKKLSADTFFSISSGLLGLLEDLRRDNIVHNRINPDNIIIDPDTLQLALIDFAKAESIPFYPPYYHPSHYDPQEVVYFSPELTGHLKSKVDHRSDLYAVGVVLYELLTSRLPFYPDEPRRLVYNILIQAPVNPLTLDIEIPKFLSDILLKLLAKAPDDRYQSAEGIRNDIALYRESLTNPGPQLAIEPGLHDVYTDLRFIEKIYGRESELNALGQCLRTAIRGDKVIVHIQGESGTGKSALAKKLRYEAIRERAVFLYGEFDFSNTGKPFHALECAFKELVSVILCEDDARLAQWKKALALASGEIGKVLTDFVPEFKWIMDEQPEVPALNGAEAQSRLQYLFQRLMESLADHNHPIILFLDDFQWADQSSCALVQSLIHYPRLQHFMLVLASRPPYEELLAHNGGSEAKIMRLDLKNLDSSVIAEMLTDVGLTGDHELAADIIHRKTQGNPFYTLQFLEALLDSNVLALDSQTNRWIFDLRQLESFHAIENVIEFILERLRDLSSECVAMLRYMSCLSRPFTAEDAAMLYQPTRSSCGALIQEASEKGLLRTDDNHYFDFSHDRIHESIYAMIDADERKKIHFSIGHRLLGTYGHSPEPDVLLETGRHLHLGFDLIPKSFYSNYLLLNYKCGKLSKEKAAFAPALEYFTRGINVLTLDDWQNNPDLALDLFILGAEAAVITGEHARAEKWANEVIERTNDLGIRFQAYEVKLNIMNENHEMLGAVELLLKLLEDLGYPIKRRPSKVDLLKELIKTKAMLWRKEMTDLQRLPAMSKLEALLFMRLSAKCTTSIFSAAPEILPLIVFKQVQLSVRYGNSPYSPVGYAAYGFAISSILGQLQRGFQFGELAIRLATDDHSGEVQSKVMSMFYGFLSYWKNDIRESIPALKKTYVRGRETGDLLYASFAATFHSSLLFFTGEKLSAVLQVMEEDSVLIREMRQHLVYIVSENQRQMVRHLTSAIETTLEITGDEMDEAAFVSKLVSKKDTATLFDFYVYKLILCSLLDHPTTAAMYAEKALKHEDDTSSHQISYPHFLMFTVLTATEAYRSAPAGKYKRIIKKALKRLEKIVKHAPANFKSMYELSLGSYQTILGNPALAIKHYTAGVEAARSNRFIHLEAIGYELLGRHYAQQDTWAFAEIYLKKAYSTFDSWGAVAKCRKLAQRYPELFTQWHTLKRTSNNQPVSMQRDIDGNVGQILQNLVQIVSDRCAAEKVLLLLKGKDANYEVKAVTGNSLIPDVSFPLSVINFINRSEQTLLCEDINEDPRFFLDNYFEQSNTKSFIGFPVVSKEQLLAIIYLENKHTGIRFSEEVMNTLESLAMLIGVSVENAILLADHESIRLLERNLNKNLLTISQSVEENERKRIAADLHDHIGAILSTSKLYLSHKKPEPHITERASHLLDEAICNLRQIAHQLSPVSLERFGLIPALKNMIQDIAQSGAFSVDLDSNLQERLAEGHELQLYRIFQELFNNSLKYSQATHVNVKINKVDDMLKCTFVENGIGFNLAEIERLSAAGKGIGLQNIHNRARIMNAKLYLHSAPGQGVTMNLEMKL